MTPGQAYAADESAREYPALPALHPRLVAMSVDAVRNEAHLAAPLPQTLAPNAPGARKVSTFTEEEARRAGFTGPNAAADYAAYINQFGASRKESDE
jgi:hypothetical protein